MFKNAAVMLVGALLMAGPWTSALFAVPLTLNYSTYLGGSSSDYGNGISVGTDGKVYLAGNTNSSDFPTGNPYQAGYRGNGDIFVTTLTSTGSALSYSTYLGGNFGDYGGNRLGTAYENRGWCRIRLEDYGQALGDFDRAIQLNPGSADAFNGRGWTKVKREKYAAALDDFRSATDLSPRYAMVFTNRGIALENLGRRDEARKNYQRVIEIDNDPEAKAYALLNLAWLDYQDGRLKSAFAFADEGVRILPDYAMGYNDRGAIREEIFSDWPGPALRLFQGKISMDDYVASYWHPNPVKRLRRRAEMLFYAGQYLLARGETDRAREYFQRSLKDEVLDSNAIRMAKLKLDEMD